MTGRSGRQNRPPLKTRKADPLASLQQSTSRPPTLRDARRRDLAHLNLEFARKITDAKLRLRGGELLAALAALESEHAAAKEAMVVKSAVKPPVSRPRRRNRCRSAHYPSPT
jgi:hypothetical protein